jgi:hypothetical protein
VKPQIKIVLYGMLVAFLLAFLQGLGDPAAFTNWRHAIPVALAGGAVAAFSWAKQSPFVKDLLSEVEQPPRKPTTTATKGRAEWLLVVAILLIAGAARAAWLGLSRGALFFAVLGALLVLCWRAQIPETTL